MSAHCHLRVRFRQNKTGAKAPVRWVCDGLGWYDRLAGQPQCHGPFIARSLVVLVGVRFTGIIRIGSIDRLNSGSNQIFCIIGVTGDSAASFQLGFGFFKRTGDIDNDLYRHFRMQANTHIGQAKRFDGFVQHHLITGNGKAGLGYRFGNVA
jgi:hypothetical protein